MAAPHRTRQPLSIDDVTIDYSAVASSAPHAADARQAASALLPPQQHQQQQQLDADSSSRQNAVSDVRAFDPGLQGVAQRYANGPTWSAGAGAGVGGGARLRRKTFFGAASPPSHAAPSSASLPAQPSVTKTSDSGSGLASSATIIAAAVAAPTSTPEGAQAARDFIATAQQHQQKTSLVALQQRRAAYTAELRRFCQHNRSHTAAAAAGDDAAAADASVQSRSVSATTTTTITTTTTATTSASPSSTPLPGLPSVGNVQTNSLIRHLFEDGVPDMEPWDRWTSVVPRYADAASGLHLVVSPHTATTAQVQAAQLHLVHHPAIPDTAYTRLYQYRDLEQPILPKEYKAKEELRAERRERLKEKQAKARRAPAAASTSAAAAALMEGAGGPMTTSTAAGRLLHDRLSTKSLALNLFASSVLNPLAADTKVLQQYELRDLEHQRRNHDRHVAALPDQILKRARDQRRHAAEAPLLRAYRVFPIYAAAHLGKLRHFANDNLLRGFVLYVGDCDALVVLAGGEVAMRHLDRWILHKMEWEHPDTRAVRLCTVPLMDAESFSFHLKKASATAAASTVMSAATKKFKGGDGRARRQDGGVDALADEEEEGREPVFINMVPTVAEGEAFLRLLPASPPSPWSDLCAVWRTAFLADGLQAV